MSRVTHMNALLHIAPCVRTARRRGIRMESLHILHITSHYFTLLHVYDTNRKTAGYTDKITSYYLILLDSTSHYFTLLHVYEPQDGEVNSCAGPRS